MTLFKNNKLTPKLDYFIILIVLALLNSVLIFLAEAQFNVINIVIIGTEISVSK